MQKYVDIDGLQTFLGKCEEKFSTQNTDTATTSSNGLMSAADKAKLISIEDSAQVNIIETVKVNGTPLIPDANKAVNITGAGGGGGLQPVIQVTCESSDITVTKSGVNYPATSHNGNIHIFPVDDYGTYDITATNELGFSSTASVKVDTVKVYTANLTLGLRFVYRIKKTEADPYERVEYLYNAVGMTPAHMDFDNGVFDYGSWADVWFVADNKPLMLKSDGTVGYYLNPNDYSKKKDGTASDVANTSYDGNAMAQFPLCWVYRYEDNDYLYEIISNVHYDSNYKAYAHTDASGNIKDYFYHSIFGASGDATKLRSLSGKTLAQELTLQNMFDGASANGSNWYIGTWSQFSLIRTLIVLIGKSTNTQAVFGNGNCYSSSSANLLQTGTLYNKGQFFGYTTTNQQVKCFHVEGLWGDQWYRVAGAFISSFKVFVKMTPEGQGYRVADTTGYINTNITVPKTSAFVSSVRCSEYGLLPAAAAGSSSTYFCDYIWANTASSLYVLCASGTVEVNQSYDGAFTYHVVADPKRLIWHTGCHLSYV